DLIWMYTQMVRIREFEERVKRTFEEHVGVIRGHTHLADGAEASIVGSLAALRPADQLLATYRCHGYPLVLGTDPKAMMAEIYGRKTGLCKGYGGSMHLTDVERGFLGTSGIVAQGIPHAVGAAYAAQIRGQGQVVESVVYRLSAHGNIIAPPGVPLHFPEHEAITVFGAPEEYEAAKRGDPVPRFRARLVTEGTLTAEEADRIAEAAREEMQEAVAFGLESPFPE